MRSGGLRALLSVVSTIMMVVLTVLLASWLPAHDPRPAPEQASIIGLSAH